MSLSTVLGPRFTDVPLSTRICAREVVFHIGEVVCGIPAEEIHVRVRHRGNSVTMSTEFSTIILRRYSLYVHRIYALGERGCFH